MGVLFGTDGVRGVANEKLNPTLAYKLGRCGAYVLSKTNDKPGRPAIVIGKDTRISGDMLEAALIAGICSVGVDVLTVGVLPTPAIAYMTRALDANAGIVISASHNPVEDNGIKFFSATGFKLPDELEDQIEGLVLDDFDDIPNPTGEDVGRVYNVKTATDRYVNFAKSTVKTDFKGLKIVVDCANGASSEVGPRIYQELGAEVIAINNAPDGININKSCGSTHPDMLRKKVRELGADLGIAHDGDADRVIAVDENGNLVDGDYIMVICGSHMKSKGTLAKDTVVVTVMSNLGLRLRLKSEDINVLETKVGDRYVMEELLKSGATFGGEQSGHIIFLEHNTTGDGIVTALQLISVVKETGLKLSELAARMQRLPQVLVNVRVNHKEETMKHPDVKKAIRAGEDILGEKGRILVRPSGTEPLVRVMAEGPDENSLQDIVDGIAAVITKVDEN